MSPKIIFLSEMPFKGKIPRTHNNMRTEFAQMCALDAVHWPMLEMNSINEQFDYAILLIGKSSDFRDRIYNVDVVKESRKFANKVIFFQEGPCWIQGKMPLHHQFWHYNVLMDVDGIFTENETDIPYYEGIVGNKKQFITSMPSLMIEDLIVPALQIKKQEKVIIGGTFTDWYAGAESFIVARDLECPVFAPSMGRKKSSEDHIPDLTYLTYMEWKDWIYKLAEFRYGIHLMPTIAAATFGLNCAYLGIPNIGYSKADTQRLCHPKLSVELYDINSARKLANMLKSDPIFYSDCAAECKVNYMEYFSEKAFNDKLERILLI